MWIIGKIVIAVLLTTGLLVIGFALGYPIGKHEGFESGSEWALVQARLAAREAGVIMPVYLEDGLFHVVLRPLAEGKKRAQPRETRCEDVHAVMNVSPVVASTEQTSLSDVPVSAKVAGEQVQGNAGEPTPDIWY